MRRPSTFGLALAILMLFSCVLVFEVTLPEANALVLFSDDFANLNNMTVINGVWDTSGSLLQGTAANGEALVWTGDLSWMYYQATANLRAVNPGGEAGLVVRYTDPANFYLLGLGSFGHKYSISRVVNGVYTELAFSGLYTEVEAGRWYTVSAVAFCGRLQLFVDGVKVLDALDYSNPSGDYSHPSGAVGFRVWQDTMQVEQLIVQSLGWSQTYGGTGSESASSVVQTSDGGYAIAGTTYNITINQDVYSDVYLVKTDASGNMLWNKIYGGTGSESASSVVQTSDGGYAIAGTTDSYGAGNNDFWLVKTDSAGNQLWTKTYGGTGSESASSVVQTSDGGYAIAGTTDSYGAGNNDFWLVKTDSAGNQLWTKTYGGTGSESASSVVQTSDGGYAIAGTTYNITINQDVYSDVYLVKTDASGNMLWNKIYGGTGLQGGQGVVQTSDDGYAIVGRRSFFGPSKYDIYLVKTDASGNMLWNKTYGGFDYGLGVYNYGFGFGVVQTSDGGYAIVGSTSSYGAGDFVYLIKTDGSGNMLWNRIYGGTGSESASSVVQTSDGGYAIAGTTDSYGAGNNDFWLVKVPGDSSPYTIHDYDGLWRTFDFAIRLSAVDDFTSVNQIYYRINDGAIKTVNSNGQPVISTEGANNKLEYWSTDSLGNEELPHKTLSGIQLDKTAPTGSIIVNSGDAFTSSISVNLALSANDLTSGVSQARYSNDGVWDTEPWETPSAFKTWTLTAGDGIKTVYYQVKDNVGLLSSTYSDTIILETPPTPTPTPTLTPTPTPSPSPTPTTIPTSTPSPSPTSTPTPTPITSPTPSQTPSPTPTTTTPQTSPTASPNPIPSPTTTLSPTATPDTATPSPSQIQSPSPSPTSQSTETPLYLYALVVFAIAAVSVAIFSIVKKMTPKK